MRQIFSIAFFALFCSFQSCKQADKKVLTFREKLEQVADSVKVGGITVKNLFKSQILAHGPSGYDSSMIIEKVYVPHQALWDNCYAMIFGNENASKFNTESGIIEWNKTLYPENKEFFEKRALELIEMNLDSVLENNLQKFDKLVPYKAEATVSIAFTPLTGILFGGCDNDQFCLELNYKEQNVRYTVEYGIPHELNHLAYEPLRKNDPDSGTALRQVIDEGFACYFTWVFFEKKISKHEAVENMTEKEWEWYLNNEKQIYAKTKEYFTDTSGDNPLLRNGKYKLFEDAPKTLYYWMGFRIVEKYVEIHGPGSWRDIYEMNVRDVFERSGYAEFISESV
ncbi:hypothetical protein FUAX_04610 [Fulvitalea axinellae]|uniref:DUF2268 domain-containing protein n=1 Tax=Fulvitalea axinellae TaxID=1182444 RepID=A0AAU9D0S1_9BACT|nr:hypothetical protein FUAX_04610 [Fulvitalea axinellae]